MTTGLGQTALVAAGAFASTNVDNLLLCSAQVAAARRDRVRRIVWGQLTGSLVVIVIAAAVAAVLFDVPDRYIGLLGFVPIAFGVRDLLALRDPERRAGRVTTSAGSGFFAALAVSFGTSGDNFAVYIPVLRHAGNAGKAVSVGVFVALEGLLCLVAVFAGRHPATLRVVDKVGVYAAPVLYLVIGVVVLVRSGAFSGF
jgi:cadmium resistance protein CadD (predicted permease)